MKKNSLSKNVPMMVQVRVDSEEFSIRKEIVSKSFGLLEDNRKIDDKRVDLFVAKIEEDNYIDTYPIMCYKADNLSALGIKIADFDGNKIPADRLADYLIIVDGQHRVAAFIKYNEKNSDKPLTVPNVNVVKADSRDDVLKFLVAINTAGKDWDDSDRWNIARNLNDKSIATSKINGLIKKHRFNQSAAQKIYLGRRLKQKEFSSLLAGDVSVIDELNKERIEIGDKFIDVCFELSGGDEKKMKFFAKRYFIEGFDDFSKGKSYDKIFEVMKKLKYKELVAVKEKEDFIEILNKAWK